MISIMQLSAMSVTLDIFSVRKPWVRVLSKYKKDDKRIKIYMVVLIFLQNLINAWSDIYWSDLYWCLYTNDFNIDKLLLDFFCVLKYCFNEISKDPM